MDWLTWKAWHVSAPKMADAISSSPESTDNNLTIVVNLHDEEEEETNQQQRTSTYWPPEQHCALVTLRPATVENAANYKNSTEQGRRTSSPVIRRHVAADELHAFDNAGIQKNTTSDCPKGRGANKTATPRTIKVKNKTRNTQGASKKLSKSKACKTCLQPMNYTTHELVFRIGMEIG